MKITSGNKTSLIIKREEGKEYEIIINHISSTEAQPYFGVNFIDGKPVGGRTMTESQKQMMIAAAKKANLIIEE
ncbi:MAG: hypothetical protein WC332_02180 [Clostridia bacterium]|jgi:hypothetical protein